MGCGQAADMQFQQDSVYSLKHTPFGNKLFSKSFVCSDKPILTTSEVNIYIEYVYKYMLHMQILNMENLSVYQPH